MQVVGAWIAVRAGGRDGPGASRRLLRAASPPGARKEKGRLAPAFSLVS
jgi:hypothetical protein